eukprot:Hpha_TRINITY_DN15792_c2_g1::TRINITY_DN15792_c2_g1_i1::g.41890::m.41890
MFPVTGPELLLLRPLRSAVPGCELRGLFGAVWIREYDSYKCQWERECRGQGQCALVAVKPTFRNTKSCRRDIWTPLICVVGPERPGRDAAVWKFEALSFRVEAPRMLVATGSGGVCSLTFAWSTDCVKCGRILRVLKDEELGIVSEPPSPPTEPPSDAIWEEPSRSGGPTLSES